MLRDIVPADARPEFIVVGTHVDNDDRRGVTQKRVQRWMEHRSLHVRQPGRVVGQRVPCDGPDGESRGERRASARSHLPPSPWPPSPARARARLPARPPAPMRARPQPSCFFEVGATTGANCEIMVDTIVERVAEQRAERGSVVNVDMSDRLSEGMVSLQQAFGAPRHAPADTADAALTPEEQLKREQAHRAERRAKRRARQPTDNGGALAGGTGKGGRGVTREAAGAARPAGAAGGGREQLGDSEGKGMAAAASGLWSSLVRPARRHSCVCRRLTPRCHAPAADGTQFGCASSR